MIKKIEKIKMVFEGIDNKNLDNKLVAETVLSKINQIIDAVNSLTENREEKKGPRLEEIDLRSLPSLNAQGGVPPTDREEKKCEENFCNNKAEIVDTRETKFRCKECHDKAVPSTDSWEEEFDILFCRQNKQTGELEDKWFIPETIRPIDVKNFIQTHFVSKRELREKINEELVYIDNEGDDEIIGVIKVSALDDLLDKGE